MMRWLHCRRQSAALRSLTFSLSLIAALQLAASEGRCAPGAQSAFKVALSSRAEQARLNQRQLSRIFSGRQRSWSSGRPIQLILLPEGSPEMRWLCQSVLKVPESLLRRFIHQKVFRGRILPVLEAESSAEALRILERRRDAIAPVRVSALSELQGASSVRQIELGE